MRRIQCGHHISKDILTCEEEIPTEMDYYQMTHRNVLRSCHTGQWVPKIYVLQYDDIHILVPISWNSDISACHTVKSEKL